MKTLSKVSALALPLLTLATPASAACYLNGAEIPCGEMPTWIFPIFGGIALLGLFFLVFWVAMLVDAIKYQENNKMMWVLLIVFLGVLGAILYYFMEKRKRKAVSK
jgi:hypothetical protein